MEMNSRYKKLNEYFKNKFGERTLKICIDGGFTCPNRDGTLSTSGCIFCSKNGSGEHIESINNIQNQIYNFLNSYRGKRANKFIAYFQNFSNTYSSLEELKEKYDSALIDDRIIGLSIATRPDCITEEICKLLKTYTDKYYVTVELGLQTSNDLIGNIINRCYTTKQFINAVSILNKYNIDTIAHIMIGLPNEEFIDIENTVKLVNSINLQGLKIHSTYVIKDTTLHKMYENNKYTPITLDYYLKCTEYILTHINPNIIIHRISGDAPKDLLVAPSWNVHKKWILNCLYKLMKENNNYQGKYYKTN